MSFLRVIIFIILLSSAYCADLNWEGSWLFDKNNMQGCLPIRPVNITGIGSEIIISYDWDNSSACQSEKVAGQRFSYKNTLKNPFVIETPIVTGELKGERMIFGYRIYFTFQFANMSKCKLELYQWGFLENFIVGTLMFLLLLGILLLFTPFLKEKLKKRKEKLKLKRVIKELLKMKEMMGEDYSEEEKNEIDELVTECQNILKRMELEELHKANEIMNKHRRENQILDEKIRNAKLLRPLLDANHVGINPDNHQAERCWRDCYILGFCCLGFPGLGGLIGWLAGYRSVSDGIAYFTVGGLFLGIFFSYLIQEWNWITENDCRGSLCLRWGGGLLALYPWLLVGLLNNLYTNDSIYL